MTAAKMIGIDWGTSSMRAYLLGNEGAILAKRERPLGIMAVAAGDFGGALQGVIGDWLHPGGSAVYMSGMIGSRQGWREVPYLATPVAFDQLAGGLGEVKLVGGGTGFIVPGVTCEDASGDPDVMRGEETQILGALSTRSGGEIVPMTYCLPGTHSKYASVRDGHLSGFATYMTGEAYAILREHSILGRLMRAGTKTDPAWFERGLARSGGDDGLLHQLFGVRSLGLFGKIPGEGLADYLSGLLVGAEIRAARPTPPIAVIGAPDLARRYLSAFALLGIDAHAVEGEAAAAGLWQIARRHGAATGIAR